MIKEVNDSTAIADNYKMKYPNMKLLEDNIVLYQPDT